VTDAPSPAAAFAGVARSIRREGGSEIGGTVDEFFASEGSKGRAPRGLERRMSMKSVSPYLYFSGNTLEAFTFYRSVFGGEFIATLRFRDFPENRMGVPEDDLDKIAHIALPLGDHSVLMGTDVVESMPMKLRVGNNVYITIEPESGDEAERLFAALASGGAVDDPLRRTEWAEKHGSCVDKFGVHWMIDYTGDAKFPA
jgi:PhnB protein